MKIHFVGIGGIGISAVAQYFRAQGHHITGTNLEHTEIIEALRKRDADVFIGRHEDYAPRLKEMRLDLVVHNPAVQNDNPEIVEAKKLGIKIMSTPQILGEITKKHFTIAICGSHGKSTITSMLAVAMINLGLDPTVIVGTSLSEFGNSNFRLGKSKFLVLEADEYKSSFLNYWPQITICSSIEADHLDYFKTYGKVVKNFQEFVGHLPEGGNLVVSKDDNVVKKLKLGKRIKFKVEQYSLKQKEAKILAKNLSIPGKHNVLNALAVLDVCRLLDKKDKDIIQAISHYRGAWRRFETKDISINTPFGPKSVVFISDYGHHPTEILKTMQACREKYKDQKIIVLQQPHQYQRTLQLKNDFIKSIQGAAKKKYFDQLVITDIYDVKGREQEAIREKINAQILAQSCKLPNVIYLRKEAIKEWLKAIIIGGEVVMILSAGDFYRQSDIV